MHRLVLLGFAAFLASLLAYSEIGLAPDFYWHLKTGLDLVEAGKSAFVDHYSYSFPGEPLAFATPIFDVTLALFYKLGAGAFGVQTFLFLIFCGALVIFSKTMSRMQVPMHLQLLGMLGLSMTFRIRYEPRPEMFGFLFIGLMLYLYFLVDRTEKSQLSRRIYIPYVLLLLLWTNVHTSSILGYAIGAALFLKIAIRQFEDKSDRASWMLWSGAGVASLVVGFFNRSFENILLHVFLPKEGTLDNEIAEFQPIDFELIGLPLQAVLILSLVGIGLSIKRKRIADAFLVAVFLMYAFNMRRMLGLFPLVAMPFLIEHFNWIFVQAKAHAKRSLALSLYALGPILLLVAVGPYLVASAATSTKLYTVSISDEQQPREIVTYMKEKDLKGRIRNEYVSGGYLLLNLSEENKIFIDGRANVLYPPSFVRDYMKASYNSLAFRAEQEKYPADFVIARSTVPGALLDTALESQEFELLYFGERHALLSRAKQGRYKLVSKAFPHPECLDQSVLPRLKQEFEFAKAEHAANSPVIEFLETAIEYFEKGDLRYFHGQSMPRTGSEHVLRLIAHLAEKSGKPALAYFYMSAIPDSRRDDRLFMARLACQHNACLGVEAMLDGFSIERAPAYDLADAAALLQEAHRKSPAVLFPPDRMKLLEERLAKEAAEVGVAKRPNWCLERN